MSSKYIVVDDGNYAPESIITTWDDLAEECAERSIDTSSIRTTPLDEYISSGRKANNYTWVYASGKRKGQFITAEDLAKEK